MPGNRAPLTGTDRSENWQTALRELFGYATALTGKWHLFRDGVKGYDEGQDEAHAVGFTHAELFYAANLGQDGSEKQQQMEWFVKDAAEFINASVLAKKVSCFFHASFPRIHRGA